MEIPWPRKGDRFFVTGGDRNLLACIVADLSLASTGYLNAADLLVESLNQNTRNDALVFPIVFCYRQSIELQLKALTETLAAFTGKTPD